MKMIFTAITGQALLTISARAQSQAWVQRYSHTAGSLDSATKVLTDADGDCIMVGYGNSGFSGRDWIIFKCNSAGFPLWTNRFSSSANADDTTQDAVLDSSGNLYVTGYAYDNTSGSSSAGITVKYSTTGEAVWTNQYRGTALGNNWATRIAVSTNGTVVILAENSDSDLATVAYSNSGIPLWTNRYDGAGHGSENPGGIAVDRDGNVFVTGKSIEANADFVTIAYSLAGNPLWTNFFNGSANGIDSARTVAVDSTGQVIVTGSSQTDTGSYQTVTIAYSNGGIPLWTNFYASSVSTEQVRPVAMSIGRDDTIFVMAYTPDSAKANASDYLTIAYSNAGVLLESVLNFCRTERRA